MEREREGWALLSEGKRDESRVRVKREAAADLCCARRSPAIARSILQPTESLKLALRFSCNLSLAGALSSLLLSPSPFLPSHLSLPLSLSPLLPFVFSPSLRISGFDLRIPKRRSHQQRAGVGVTQSTKERRKLTVFRDSLSPFLSVTCFCTHIHSFAPAKLKGRKI